MRRRWGRILGRFWAEALLTVLLALPWLALFGLGFAWLWQNGRVLEWALAATAIGLLGWPLRRLVERRAAERLAALQAVTFPEEGWNPEEREAWRKVEALAAETPPLDTDERDRAEALLRETVLLVARHFRGDHPDVLAQVTVPEALLLAETLSRRMRRWMLENLPGARHIKVSHVLWAQRMEERYGAAARTALEVGETLWRVFRAASNPINAAAQEANRFVFNRTKGIIGGGLRAKITRQLVLETGRAAIELYSGRLRISAAELASAARQDAGSAEAEPPLRLLLVGQAGAGKTALLNALAGALRGDVGMQSHDGRVREHLVTQQGRPALAVVDMPPLGEFEEFLAEARRADLILWVTQATRPDRAGDLQALQGLRGWAAEQRQRRVPPLAVALTGADRLRPATEWPPGETKRAGIEAARAAVAAALEVPVADVVALALRPGEEPWNLDALWTAIERELDAARAARFERLRERAERLDLAEEAARAGRAVIGLGKGLLNR
jgi:predicted GTPase